MMKNRKDYTGQKFGNLTAISFSRYDSIKQKTYWNFKCDCGNTKELLLSNVLSGNTRTCGCIMKEVAIKNCHIENNTTLKNNIEKNILKKNNKTGCTGVSFDKKRNKYYASIYYHGKSYGLGRYEKLDDAIMARKIAEDEIINNSFEEYINKMKIAKMKGNK